MSNQELPDWDWVRKLEVDYLPIDVQELVQELGVLIYVYGRAVDEGKSLWDEIRISQLEYRVKNLEIQFKKFKESNSTTLAELLTTLVLSAALSTGLGLLVSAIASRTAGLAKSALSWHKAAKEVIPAGTVYTDIPEELVKKLLNEVENSKRILAKKAFYKELDKKLEIGSQAKGISDELVSSFVKGEITLFKDNDRKPSKDVGRDLPISQIINEHWNGLFATVRTAKQDLDTLLEKYKYFHDVGMLDATLKDDKSLKELRKPLRPQLFQSIMELIPKRVPGLAAPLLMIHDGNVVTGEMSNRLRETFRDVAREQFAHIFVFQLSALIFTPEVIMSGVKFTNHNSLSGFQSVSNLVSGKRINEYGIRISEKGSEYSEFISPYWVGKSSPVLIKVDWKDTEFKAYIASLLSLLYDSEEPAKSMFSVPYKPVKPDEYNRTYLSHARNVVTLGKEKTLTLTSDPEGKPGVYLEDIHLKPPSKEEAILEYAFILYTRDLLRYNSAIWSTILSPAWPANQGAKDSSVPAALRRLIGF